MYLLADNMPLVDVPRDIRKASFYLRPQTRRWPLPNVMHIRTRCTLTVLV